MQFSRCGFLAKGALVAAALTLVAGLASPAAAVDPRVLAELYEADDLGLGPEPSSEASGGASHYYDRGPLPDDEAADESGAPLGDSSLDMAVCDDPCPMDGLEADWFVECDEEAETAIELPAAEALVESGIELFAPRPAELLSSDDQRLLRHLESLCEGPSAVRREMLNAYLESLGLDAVALASRFERSTGIATLPLADDPCGLSAFLAVYRVFERGELGLDESVDLLRRSLRHLTSQWLLGVRTITGDAFAAETAAISPPVESSVEIARGLGAAVAGAATAIADGLERNIAQWARVEWSVYVRRASTQLALRAQAAKRMAAKKPVPAKKWAVLRELGGRWTDGAAAGLRGTIDQIARIDWTTLFGRAAARAAERDPPNEGRR